MLKENSKSVVRVWFAILCEFSCIVLKMNQGYASISIDATPPEHKSRYVNETSWVVSLFNQHCTEYIMTTYIVDLYFKYFSETRY